MTHYRNQRLFVNAGMRFPECYSGAKLLDVDKGRLETTPDIDKVTCKRCLRLVNKGKLKVDIWNVLHQAYMKATTTKGMMKLISIRKYLAARQGERNGN